MIAGELVFRFAPKYLADRGEGRLPSRLPAGRRRYTLPGEGTGRSPTENRELRTTFLPSPAPNTPLP